MTQASIVSFANLPVIVRIQSALINVTSLQLGINSSPHDAEQTIRQRIANSYQDLAKPVRFNRTDGDRDDRR
jgi:hypothetical protein